MAEMQHVSMTNPIPQRLPVSTEAVSAEDDFTPSPSPKSANVDLTISLSSTLVQRVLGILVIALVIATFAAQLLKWRGTALEVARFFDADVKVNFPTAFKVFALAAGALLAWAVSRVARVQNDPWARHWRLLAAVMAFVTLDEMAYVHQSLARFLSDHVDTTGILYYAWIIVYLPIALLIGVRFLPFVLALRSDLRTRLVASGILFAGGSGGVEMLKGHFASSEGENSLRFLLTTALSDSLEMIGLAIFVGALLVELGRRAPSIALRVVTPSA